MSYSPPSPTSSASSFSSRPSHTPTSPNPCRLSDYQTSLRRASHNAVERARKDSQRMIPRARCPPFQLKIPPAPVQVDSRQLFHRTRPRRGVNQWRARAGLYPAVAPPRSEGFSLVIGGEKLPYTRSSAGSSSTLSGSAAIFAHPRFCAPPVSHLPARATLCPQDIDPAVMAHMAGFRGGSNAGQIHSSNIDDKTLHEPPTLASRPRTFLSTSSCLPLLLVLLFAPFSANPPSTLVCFHPVVPSSSAILLSPPSCFPSVSHRSFFFLPLSLSAFTHRPSPPFTNATSSSQLYLWPFRRSRARGRWSLHVLLQQDQPAARVGVVGAKSLEQSRRGAQGVCGERCAFAVVGMEGRGRQDETLLIVVFLAVCDVSSYAARFYDADQRRAAHARWA
ncbi:hypothetical protein B0H13DRAFT_2366444 [Mycena leptocephala]|nr:hypothetical protein B0H13DRAFT_2366444 [Mycena leptocephala]